MRHAGEKSEYLTKHPPFCKTITTTVVAMNFRKTLPLERVFQKTKLPDKSAADSGILLCKPYLKELIRVF
jgi:hypothetical protein